MTDIIELLGLAMALLTNLAAAWNYHKDREWQFWAFLCLFNLGWVGAM